MNQQVDVAECIAVLLMEQGQVVLPGLGSFIGTYESSKADQLLGLVEPPSLQIKFNLSSSDPGGNLVAWMCTKYQLSPLEASRLVEEFVRSTKIQLQKKELVVIPKVGRLRLDFEGNLQFLPDTVNINLDAFGLPTFHVFPVKHLASPPVAPLEPESSTDTPLPEVTSNTLYGRSRLNAGWLLGVGILVCTVFAYILLSPKINVFISESAARKEKRASAVVTTPKSAVVQPEQLKTDTARVDTPAISKLPEISQRSCIIGLGVFREQGNVDKLVNQIRDAGYVPYTEQVGKLTRVGIQFTYTHEDEVAEKLALIQGKLEPAAIILKK